jgi:hypothetical protein
MYTVICRMEFIHSEDEEEEYYRRRGGVLRCNELLRLLIFNILNPQKYIFIKNVMQNGNLR